MGITLVTAGVIVCGVAIMATALIKYIGERI